MALSLKALLGPAGAPVAEMLLVVTYVVVVFSVLVQGITAGPAVRRWLAA